MAGVSFQRDAGANSPCEACGELKLEARRFEETIECLIQSHQKFLGFFPAVVHVPLRLEQDEVQHILVSVKLVKLPDAPARRGVAS